MCTMKEDAQTKIDRLIAAIERLCALMKSRPVEGRE